MRLMLYSFVDKDNKVRLDYSLTKYLDDYADHRSDKLIINLPNGSITLNKGEYMNKDKVYYDGKYFFIVATKWLSTKYALKVLLRFACTRLEYRLATYKNLITA